MNVIGTKNLVNKCSTFDIPILFVSSDYVFNGIGTNYWNTTDKTDPINYYGKTKESAEIEVAKLKKHFIVRTSWVFGINGNNFVNTMLNISKKTNTVKVVNDQIGSPTYTHDLAILLSDMITTKKYGTYHAHNEGICSWADFAKEIYKVNNIDSNVIPINSEEYNNKAKRPLNSRMSTESLQANGFSLLPDWKDAIERYSIELKTMRKT